MKRRFDSITDLLEAEHETGCCRCGRRPAGHIRGAVFDYCLDVEVKFDFCIGVSAGSASIVSYVAGQKGRNYVFYADYPFRKEYMSLRNLIRKRSYL